MWQSLGGQWERIARGGGTYDCTRPPTRPALLCETGERVRRTCSATGRRFIVTSASRLGGGAGHGGGAARRRVDRRAGWSSYPSGVLRACLCPPGHASVAIARRPAPDVAVFRVTLTVLRSVPYSALASPSFSVCVRSFVFLRPSRFGPVRSVVRGRVLDGRTTALKTARQTSCVDVRDSQSWIHSVMGVLKWRERHSGRHSLGSERVKVLQVGAPALGPRFDKNKGGEGDPICFGGQTTTPLGRRFLIF